MESGKDVKEEKELTRTFLISSAPSTSSALSTASTSLK